MVACWRSTAQRMAAIHPTDDRHALEPRIAHPIDETRRRTESPPLENGDPGHSRVKLSVVAGRHGLGHSAHSRGRRWTRTPNSATCLAPRPARDPSRGRLRSMQIGAVYPQNELRGDPSAVRRIGKAVEDLGFDHLLAYDHVLGAVHADRTPPLTGPYTEHDPFHDPFVMFAYLAALTERIRFTTGILVLPQRQTALVARQAADLDLLSGGRLRMGVGVGWNHVEYEALGQDFHTRGARQEEQIVLLRRLFTEAVVDFSGRFDRVDRASLLPKPARSIPIWLGGHGEVAFERAARLADGFIFFGGDAAHVAEDWKRLRDRVGALGRSVDDFGADWVVLSRGGVGDLAAEIEAWREAGGTHVSVDAMGRGLDSADGHIDYLASVADALSLS
jgi:probable F420-dependent oxidoreductase